MIPEPIKIVAEDNFDLVVHFADGKIFKVNFKEFIGDSVKSNAVKNSLAVFKTAEIEDGLSINWSNGFSLDPDVVYTEGEAVSNLKATASFISIVKDKYSVR